MPESNIRSITVTSKGQVTLSASARKHLGIEQGTTLIEIVVGNCLVLLPQNSIMHQLRTEAAAAIQRAGVTAAEIIAEADRLREERFSERYPGIGE
jgi:bifunctional DNA-binding transcriptional regulator/antitoxin component of YhaV-PrlF toxin-antitoxin module